MALREAVVAFIDILGFGSLVPFSVRDFRVHKYVQNKHLRQALIHNI
jgi:hypothetical protein